MLTARRCLTRTCSVVVVSRSYQTDPTICGLLVAGSPASSVASASRPGRAVADADDLRVGEGVVGRRGGLARRWQRDERRGASGDSALPSGAATSSSLQAWNPFLRRRSSLQCHNGSFIGNFRVRLGDASGVAVGSRRCSAARRWYGQSMPRTSVSRRRAALAVAVSIHEARAAVLEHVSVLGSEEVGLDDALGRALADDAVAPNHVPPFDASAMDGYAILAADTAGGSARLELIGEAKAGTGAGVTVEPGTAVRISTGAPVPDGADAIAQQELTSLDGATIVVDGAIRKGAPAPGGRGHPRRRARHPRRLGARARRARRARVAEHPAPVRRAPAAGLAHGHRRRAHRPRQAAAARRHPRLQRPRARRRRAPRRRRARDPRARRRRPRRDRRRHARRPARRRHAHHDRRRVRRARTTTSARRSRGSASARSSPA